MDWLTTETLFSFGETLSTEKVKVFSQSPKTFADYEQFFLTMAEHMGNNLLKRHYNKKCKQEKSDTESSKWRKVAQYVSIPEEFQYCTKAIAHGIPKSQKVAQGHYERAMILVNLKSLSNESVREIDRGLECDCSDKLRMKLHLRRAQCCLRRANECYKESKFWLSKVPTSDKNRKIMEGILKDHEAFDQSKLRDVTL